eukprot:g1762.t1
MLISRRRHLKSITSYVLLGLRELTTVVLLMLAWIFLFSIIFYLAFRGVTGPGPNGNCAMFQAKSNNNSNLTSCPVYCRHLFDDELPFLFEEAKTNISDSICFNMTYEDPTPNFCPNRASSTLSGCSAFSKNCRDYFRTWIDTCLHLFAMTTTVNYPDIMLPVMDCAVSEPTLLNIFGLLLFPFFILFAIYFLMNVILAMAYEVFRKAASTQVKRIKSKSEEKAYHAFHLLAALSAYRKNPKDKSFDIFKKKTIAGEKNKDTLTLALSVHESESFSAPTPATTGSSTKDNHEPIPLTSSHSPGLTLESVFKDTISAVDLAQFLFTFRGITLDVGAEIAEIITCDDSSGRKNQGINWDQFRGVMHFIDTHKIKPPRSTYFGKKYIEAFLKTYIGRKLTAVQLNGFGKYNPTRQYLENFIFSDSFVLTSDVAIAINIMFICMTFLVEDVFIADAKGSLKVDFWCALKLINLLFAILFFIEVILRLFVTAPLFLRHFREGYGGPIFMTLDSLSVFATIIYYIPNFNFNIPPYLIQLVRMFRFTKILKVSSKQKTIIGAIVHTIPLWLRYIAVLVCLYYFLAIIGMEAFAGLIPNYANTTENSFSNLETRVANGAVPGITTESLDKLLKSSYGEAKYYSNNFNSFGTAMVVMWEMTIVNNWVVIMEGYLAVTQTIFTSFYFILVYMLIVLIMMNITTAYFIDAYHKNINYQKISQDRSHFREKILQVSGDAEAPVKQLKERIKSAVAGNKYSEKEKIVLQLSAVLIKHRYQCPRKQRRVIDLIEAVFSE